jgi:hypothetical protein
MNLERDEDRIRQSAEGLGPALSEPEADSLKHAHRPERARDARILLECGGPDSPSATKSGRDDRIVRIDVQSNHPPFDEGLDVGVDKLEELECDQTQYDPFNNLGGG